MPSRAAGRAHSRKCVIGSRGHAPEASDRPTRSAVRRDAAGQKIVDAYCGVGLHARRLANAGAEVVGIELDPHAAAEAARGGVRIVEDTVESALPAALPADLVILNPPRGGVDPLVIAALVQTPPPRIIYVSCDPATLARDISRLRDFYALTSVRCFDLFPQTTHVETVVELTCSIT